MGHNQIGVKTIHKQAMENAIIAEYYKCSSGVVIYLSTRRYLSRFMVREAKLILMNSFISRIFVRKLYARFCCAVDVYMVDFILVSVS